MAAKKTGPRKKWLWVAPACVILLGIALLLGGNYLVSFAIGRATGTADIAPESTLSETDTQNIIDTWREQRTQADTWIAASAVESVSVTSEDGLRLSGELVIPNDASHLWLIAVHGYRSKHGDMLPLASYYGLQGWNVLLPDLRGCGESEGSYIGMGWPDRRDMLRWIDLILSRDSEAQIVLHGVSMGGATVMMTAGEALPEQVRAVVEDCGYTSVWDIFKDELAYLFHLPAFPVLNVASGISALRAGYSFTEASALEQVERAAVPMLFIHGSEDNFVHTDMVYSVYEACPSEKQLLVVDGAGHGNSYSHDPDQYFETVFSFLYGILDDEAQTEQRTEKEDQSMSIYNIPVTDNHGVETTLAQYQGKVLLVVNTATRCGLTPQYEGLEALYEKYQAQGLEILDFPCNQFAFQAPGSDEKIDSFCKLKYDTKFPRFAKINVNGGKESPLYTYLKSQKQGRIKWNFTKFLISRDGEVIERFEPTVKPAELESAIQAALA